MREGMQSRGPQGSPGAATAGSEPAREAPGYEARPGAVRVLYRAGYGAEQAARWARERGHEARPVGAPGTAGFMLRWNAAARQGVPLLYLDYPLDDPEDLRTLERFTAEALEAGQNTFYVPRPNPHLSGAPVALALAPRPARVPARAIASTALSGALRAAFMTLKTGFRVRVESAVRALRARLAPRAASPYLPERAPAAVVPDWLGALGGDWRWWDPGPEVMRRDLVQRAERFYPAPRSLMICLLNKCNLHCKMCPYHSPKYTGHHSSDYLKTLRKMPPEVFARIADYAARHRVGLFFGQIEEPLLHEDIFDFFRQARDKGVRDIHLSSNGTLLTRDKALALARSGVSSVRFSLDAASPEAYRAIRGKDLDEVERNIAYFLRLARPRGIVTSVAFILQPEAMGERHEFLEKWRRMGVDEVVIYGLAEYDLKTGEPRVNRLLMDRGERYPCSQPWIQAAVFPEGEVSVCCRTLASVGWRGVLSMGDLRGQDFDSVWSGERFRAMRAELLSGDIEEFDVCRACPAWTTDVYGVEETPAWRRAYNFTMELFSFNRLWF